MKKQYMDRVTVSEIKGIALILMFAHHFLTFPNWWPRENMYPIWKQYSVIFREPFKICVPLFCFITGYFYFHCKNKNMKYSLKKITDILTAHLFVFICLAMFAVIFCDYKYTRISFIEECFALSRPTMVFGWYVYFYIASMLLLPFCAFIMSKTIYLDLLVLYLGTFVLEHINGILNNQIFHQVFKQLYICFPVILAGYIFASWNIFEKLETLNLKYIKSKFLNIWLYFFGVLFVPLGRNSAPWMNVSVGKIAIHISMDTFYAPIFIYCFIGLCKYFRINILSKILQQIGNQSMLMWFLSCAFFGTSRKLFKPILYWPSNPIAVLLWGIFLCYLVAIIMDLAIKRIQNLKNKFFFTDKNV